MFNYNRIYHPTVTDMTEFSTTNHPIRKAGRTKRDGLSGKKSRYLRRKAEKASQNQQGPGKAR